jgi:hypothetical protein
MRGYILEAKRYCLCAIIRVILKEMWEGNI